jgi:hypothetical protein
LHGALSAFHYKPKEKQQDSITSQTPQKNLDSLTSLMIEESNNNAAVGAEKDSPSSENILNA